jgi:hypothetical protein
MWVANLLPSVWKHHTLKPRLSTMTGINRESAGTSKVQSFPLNCLPYFWILGHIAWLFCFIKGVIYPQFKNRWWWLNCAHSIHMHLPKFAAPFWWRQTTAIMYVMANYKMRLAGSYEYNNELFLLAEPSLPSLRRFHSNELIWTK